jgi:hypothetical protein
MPRRHSPIRCTKQTRSFHPKDPGRARTVLGSRRARLQACSRPPAPTHRNKRYFPASSSPACLNHRRVSHLHILTYNQTVLRTLHLRRSWETRCARVAYPRESRRHRLTRFRLLRNNSLRHPRSHPTTQEHRNQIRISSRTTSPLGLTHNSRPRNHRRDLPRLQVQWLAR